MCIGSFHNRNIIIGVGVCYIGEGYFVREEIHTCHVYITIQGCIDHGYQLGTGDVGIRTEGSIGITGNKTETDGLFYIRFRPVAFDIREVYILLVCGIVKQLREDGGGLTALIYPDYQQGQNDGMDREQLEQRLMDSLPEFNKLLPAYAQLKKIELMPEDFERTPKKSIKRYLYQRNK